VPETTEQGSSTMKTDVNSDRRTTQFTMARCRRKRTTRESKWYRV